MALVTDANEATCTVTCKADTSANVRAKRIIVTVQATQ